MLLHLQSPELSQGQKKSDKLACRSATLGAEGAEPYMGQTVHYNSV